MTPKKAELIDRLFNVAQRHTGAKKNACKIAAYALLYNASAHRARTAYQRALVIA